MDGAISQLHSLTIRNGYNRPSNTLPRQSNKPNWTTLQWQMQQQQQHQQIQSPQTHNVNYATMHMDPIQLIQQQHKSTTGSESGSSTGGDLSPPPQNNNNNPTDIGLHGNTNQSQSSGLRNKTLNLNRLNGSGNQSSQQQMHQTNNLDFNGTQNNPVPNTQLVSSSSSGNLLLIGGQMHNYPTYRNLPGTATIQRQFPTQINGELTAIYPFNTPVTTFIPTQVVTSQPQQQNRVSPSQTPPVILPTPYPTNKLVQSCFNCGSINHTGLNCSEASMEDVTRNAIYKLDYTVSSAQSQFSSTPVLTATSSSGNLNQLQGSNQSASSINNNSEPEIFIDLTQDTSSDSSISNR